THVPYKGGTPGLMDVIAGNVNMMIIQPLSREQITSGQLRALAVSSSKRSRHYPDIPTVDEAGVPGYASVAWYGLVAPKDMPPAVLEKLSEEVMRGAKSEAVKKIVDAQGGDLVGGTPEQFAEFIAAERKRYETIVREAGISVE